MLQFVLIHRQFLHKCFWISFGYICDGGLDGGFLANFIEAVGAAALTRLAKDALSEALAVELQALGAGTMACVGQHHWFQH